MNTEQELYHTFRNSGQSPEEASKNARIAAQALSASGGNTTQAAQEKKKGSISEAVVAAIPGKGQFFGTGDLVQAAMQAGAKNLASARELVSVILRDAKESNRIKRVGYGKYLSL